MGLKEKQNVLARLCVDADFRRSFLEDPDTQGARSGLNPEEIEELRAVSASQIATFGESLHYKRMSHVRSLLPLTAMALGGRFEAEFMAYADSFLPRGVHKHEEDALRFAANLARAKAENADALQVSELARYEATWIAQRSKTRCWAARRFRLDLGHCLRAAGSEPITTPRRRRTTLAFWIKPAGFMKLRHLWVVLPC